MIYVVVFLVSVMLLSLAERKKYSGAKAKFQITLALLIPSILAGVRDYSIGGDVLLYGNHWFVEALTSESCIIFLKRANGYSINPGYALLNYIVSRFTENAHWFYFILALLEMIVLYKALIYFKDKISIPFSFFIFFCFYYNDSFNLLRQMPAMIIVLYAMRYVEQRKIIKFLICIVVASSFHFTAFIAVLLYPIAILAVSQLSTLYSILVVVGSAGSAIGVNQIVTFLASLGIINGARYIHYFDYSGSAGGRVVRSAVFVALLMMFILVKKKIIVKDPAIEVYYFYCLISTLMTTLIFIFMSSNIIRIAYYFDITMILYLPMLTEYIKFKGKKQKYAVVGIATFMYWILVYVIRNGASTFPYVLMQL